MSNKLPAFQFYPGDWRKDSGIQSLSFHDRGVWFEILCLMHESEQRGKLTLNGRPMPEEALARLLGLDKQNLTKALATLIDYGVASRDENGALINRRMVRDENLRKIRQEAGKMGGNPALVKQNPTKTKNGLNQNPNQTPTPSVSVSISEEREGAREPEHTHPQSSLSPPSLSLVANRLLESVGNLPAGSAAPKPVLVAEPFQSPLDDDLDDLTVPPLPSLYDGTASEWTAGDDVHLRRWIWKLAPYAPTPSGSNPDVEKCFLALQRKVCWDDFFEFAKHLGGAKKNPKYLAADFEVYRSRLEVNRRKQTQRSER